jgi:hypothetical protein
VKQVFITYRQIDDKHRERVRSLGERLRGCGVEVILDQFFLEANPGGSDKRWAKLTSDWAFKTEHVLIVGNSEWFDCFDGTQPPGTGLGAAHEAGAIRQRIYEHGMIGIRVILFDEAEAKYISGDLRGYQYFHADRDFDEIVRWLGGTLEGNEVAAVNNLFTGSASLEAGKSNLRKEDNPFQTAGALRYDHGAYIRRGCDKEFEHCICGSNRLISITGEFGIGKSSLMQQARRILTDYQFFGGGLADLGGHDESLFMKNFFRLFAKQFGSISEWDELQDHVRRWPSVLFLDDIGEVAAKGVQALIPALVTISTRAEVNLRVIATSSQPLQAVFADRGLHNPKYSKAWTRISITTCNNEAARELLQLLPNRSRAIAIGQLHVVKGMSEFAPQRLQCLCRRLFDAECDRLSDKELSSLIANSCSYE